MGHSLRTPSLAQVTSSCLSIPNLLSTDSPVGCHKCFKDVLKHRFRSATQTAQDACVPWSWSSLPGSLATPLSTPRPVSMMGSTAEGLGGLRTQKHDVPHKIQIILTDISRNEILLPRYYHFATLPHY